jgi:hypothetical protein
VRPRKLTNNQIEWIRALFAARKALPTVTQIAKKLGVSRQLVSQIGNSSPEDELCDTVSGLNGAESEAQRRSS